jgi:hypothetical protein
MEVGRTVNNDATNETLFEKGKFPIEAFLFQGDGAALQPVCDALAQS